MSLPRTGVAAAVERFAVVAARSVMAPLLTPFPGTVGPTIQQFDCRSYWVRSSEPPHKVEQQTVCFGWRIVP